VRAGAAEARSWKEAFIASARVAVRLAGQSRVEVEGGEPLVVVVLLAALSAFDQPLDPRLLDCQGARHHCSSAQPHPPHRRAMSTRQRTGVPRVFSFGPPPSARPPAKYPHRRTIRWWNVVTTTANYCLLLFTLFVLLVGLVDIGHSFIYSNRASKVADLSITFGTYAGVVSPLPRVLQPLRGPSLTHLLADHLRPDPRHHAHRLQQARHHRHPQGLPPDKVDRRPKGASPSSLLLSSPSSPPRLELTRLAPRRAQKASELVQNEYERACIITKVAQPSGRNQAGWGRPGASEVQLPCQRERVSACAC